MRLAIFGLGKLGAPLAAVYAHAGHDVVGVDLSPETIAAINSPHPPFEEPGLAEMIMENRDRIVAIHDGVKATRECEASFIIVPTPSRPDGAFSSDLVIKVAQAIGQGLRERDDYHLVVLCSTVMPGTTGGELQAELESVSGKRCGPDFGLCYNPEFIALGSVIRDMLNPDMFLVGEVDQRAGDMLERIHKSVVPDAPVERMNFVNAELAKIGVNTFVTTKIAYANMLAEVCENLEGADVDVVTTAIGRDSRIGRKYLKGALGYGGPCFPRDNVAFDRVGELCGLDLDLTKATQRANARQAIRVAAKAAALNSQNGTVAVLGLSYKPDTPVIEESQGLKIVKELVRRNVNVTVHDPIALPGVRAELGDSVVYAESFAQGVREADVVVVATAWEEYKSLEPGSLKAGAIVIDCWRILQRAPFERNGCYVTIGVGDELRGPEFTIRSDAANR